MNREQDIEVCLRLAAYEELGVTPNQIREISTAYRMVCEELAKYKKLAKDAKNRTVEEFLNEVCKASERARPVGWPVRQEIVQISRVREIAELMKTAGEVNE